MNSPIKQFLPLQCLLLVLALNAFPLRAQSKDVEDVLAAERAWCAAFLHGDPEAIRKAELKDYTLTDSKGRVTTRQDDIDDATGGKVHYTQFENRNMKVRIHGDTAIVTGRTLVKGTVDGSPVDVEVQFTDTLVRINGRWIGAAGHVSRIRNGPA